MSEESAATTPFFRRFPVLARSLPHVPVGVFPTPLRVLKELPHALAVEQPPSAIYLKDDGLSSPIYGGNKVRKLELVLADALRRGAREVMTFGFAGSNHAAATAVHAAKLGLRSISMLLPQANAPYVGTNLAVSAAVGAELHYYRTMPGLIAGVIEQTAAHRLRTGQRPYVIAPGGSSPLGTIGFVAAAFELAEQLEREALTPPDAIYVALGSGGTAVGLALGFAAAGLPTAVVAVRVTEVKHANERKAAKLWRETVALLRSVAPRFPALEFDRARLAIRDEFYGDGYAVVTPKQRKPSISYARREHPLGRRLHRQSLRLLDRGRTLWGVGGKTPGVLEHLQRRRPVRAGGAGDARPTACGLRPYLPRS